MKRRKFEEALLKGFMIASVMLILAILTAIVSVIVLRGISSLSLSMVIQTPEGGYYLGKGGGIANAIVGSLYLAFGATFLSFLLGLPIAFALAKRISGPPSRPHDPAFPRHPLGHPVYRLRGLRLYRHGLSWTQRFFAGWDHHPHVSDAADHDKIH